MEAAFPLPGPFNTIVYLRNYRFDKMPRLDVSTAGVWELSINAWQRVSYKYDPPAGIWWRDYEVYEILMFI